MVSHSSIVFCTKLGFLEHFHITVVIVLSHNAFSLPTADGGIPAFWQPEEGVAPSWY